MMTAPIILFTYRRATHTKRCIESLKQSHLASESILYIFSDAAKGGADMVDVLAVRSYIKSITGFKEVIIEEATQNRGLADSVIYGVGKVLDKHGRAIVLEDDLVLSPHFLSYMNEALEMYKEVEEVININSHVLSSPMTFDDNFLISFANSWGWATWKRGWRYFEPDANKLLEKIKEEKREREFDMGYHFTRMLKEQCNGKINSWAVRWNASLFVNRKLSLNVGKPLVANSGFGAGATHCNTPDLFSVKLYADEIHPQMITPVVESREMRNKLRKTYMIRTSYINKLRVAIVAMLKRIFL
ncbi:MAG: glycosyltransferase family 2 protein [Bacteroidales bacterium]|nr:glycosyltransferase family 2 protein [Bacteroidales bacterium]